MDYEPVPKRRRTASPPLLQASNSNIPPRIPPPVTKSPAGEDDKTYQQHLERAFADPRFRATLAQIFDKYDGKSAQPDEAIDPTLCGTSTGDSYLAQSDGLVDNDNLPYHLDTRRCEPKDDDAETADYEVGRLNETHGPCDPRAAPPGYMPTFSGGEVHPNFMQSWYGNPFQAPGPYPSPWDGFSGQIPMPNGPMVPNGLPMTTGSWISPDNFVCNPATWPPQAMQPPPVNCQIDPALEISPPAQEKTSNGTSSEEERRKAAQADESTDNCPPEMIVSFDALGRKRRRRLAQPRFSKNGKRLGRPPKPAGAPGVASETAAYDGEGEDEGHGELLDIKNPAGEFCDEDDDTLWNELAEALQLASKATSKKRNRNGTKPPQKGEHSATESDGAIEMDKDSGQAEIMLRKIQQELIDRAVRRSTMAKEHGDDSDAAAEGRRRSGRDRKPANFGEQVSWDKVSAERRTSYKIKMHLRALSVQARQERKKKEKEEAEVAARQKEEAEKAKKEKQEAEKLAAAAAASASGKGTTEEPGESMPSTIPDSQDTVISLPIRTTPKKPQSNQIMRQTIKNHVNSVVHFEEDDEGLSDNDTPTAPAIFPLKNPVLAFKKPEIHVHSFLGENYIDTVYALSDDEAPALLTSMKRVSLTKKQKISRVPVALARPRETFNTEEQDCLEAAEQTVPSGGAERHASEGPASNIPIATNTMLDPQMDTSETTQVPVCKPTELDKSTRPSITIHGDGDDSGIDIRSEQAPSEQAEGPVPTISVPAKPLSQDHDLLGTADILDSLDVMSGTEDSPSSPVSDFAFPTDDIEINDVEAPSTTTSLISSRRTDEPLLVDDDSINESMDIFKDVAADIPLASDEEAEMEYNESLETTTNVSKQSHAQDNVVEGELRHEPLITKNNFTNSICPPPRPDEFGMDSEEAARPLPHPNLPASSSRHPLPQQNISRRNENRKSLPSWTSKASTPKATPKEPSPGSTGARSRLPSSSSSRTSAPDSKSSSLRKGSSSSRRSLLSLIGGGEDDVETLIKGKYTTSAAKSTHTVMPARSIALSKESSATPRSTTSRRRSQPSSSSLTRLSLGSLSSLSRDKPRTSRERQEAKERRRKSTGATSRTVVPAEKKGTCGVDGYTCERDFCFTCL